MAMTDVERTIIKIYIDGFLSGHFKATVDVDSVLGFSDNDIEEIARHFFERHEWNCKFGFDVDECVKVFKQKFDEHKDTVNLVNEIFNDHLERTVVTEDVDDEDDYEYDNDHDSDADWDDFADAIAQADLNDMMIEIATMNLPSTSTPDDEPTVNTCLGCGDDISGLVNCPRCGLVANIVREIVEYIRSFANYGLTYSYASECIVVHNGDRGTMQIYIHPDDGVLIMEAWHWADSKSWGSAGVDMDLLYREFKSQMKATKKVGGE